MDRRMIALVVALTAPLYFLGAWDSSKPATNALLNSAEIRSNWQALEQSPMSENLIEDPTFQLWPAGTSAAPYGWVLSGTGAAVAQETGGTNLNGLGPYSVKVTFGSATANLDRTALPSAAMLNYFRARTFSFTAYVKASSASQARLTITDGVGSTSSSYHTGGGTFEQLKVTRTLDAAATLLTFRLQVESAGSVYMQGASATFGAIPGTVLIPAQSLFDTRQILRAPYGLTTNRLTTYSLGGSLSAQTNTATTSGTTATDMHTFSVPGGTLATNGDRLRIHASGTMTSNSNSKTFTLQFGATAITLSTGTGIVTGYEIYGDIVRTGAATQIMVGELYYDAYTISFGAVVRGAPAETLANAITVKTRHTMATSGTITEEQFHVEYVPAP